MRTYAELIKEARPVWTIQGPDVELVLLDSYEYETLPHDYGLALVYHFLDRGLCQRYTELVHRIERLIKEHPSLSQVEVVPFYEIGDDFLVQCKPFDEGYDTETFQEYLTYGSCRPAPWFFKQWCELQEAVDEVISTLGTYERRLLHSQLIKPNSHLYWADEDGWLLYAPSTQWDDYQYDEVHLFDELASEG